MPEEKIQLSHFIKNLLSQTLDSQNSTHHWCKTPMPLNLMHFVKLNSIVNEYGSDSWSFEA